MPSDVLVRPLPPPGERLAYGDDSAQFGELRLPAGAGTHPLAIVVHGGAWRSAATLDRTAHLCAALADDGVATWNLEYRRLGASGGGFPRTFLDVAAGTDFAVRLAERAPLDLGRVALVGHSSGGHLAAWLAGRARIPVGSEIAAPPLVRVRALVALAGALDLARCSALEVRDAFEHRVAVHELLGGPPAIFPGRYAAASPIRLLPTGCATLAVHGDADERMPPELSRAYVAAARAAGDDAKLLTLAGGDHYDPLDPRGDAYAPMLVFLRAALEV